MKFVLKTCTVYRISFEVILHVCWTGVNELHWLPSINCPLLVRQVNFLTHSFWQALEGEIRYSSWVLMNLIIKTPRLSTYSGFMRPRRTGWPRTALKRPYYWTAHIISGSLHDHQVNYLQCYCEGQRSRLRSRGANRKQRSQPCKC